MSGKSTLLRTVGVNAVLALAGAPVRARRLRLSPLAVGATLRIQDSLQAGHSRFYAEITRIRAIVELADGPLPLLFLLDELLNGTNSHDRRIGAEAILCGAARPRRDRPGHDARSRAVAIADRLEPRPRTSTSRTTSSDGRVDVRLPDAPGRGHDEQRAGADAGGGARGVATATLRGDRLRIRLDGKRLSEDESEHENEYGRSLLAGHLELIVGRGDVELHGVDDDGGLLLPAHDRY